MPHLRRQHAAAPFPRELPDRREQPQQRDLLAERAARHVAEFLRAAGQRDPDPLPGEEVRADLRQPAILPEGGQARLDRDLQVDGLREDLAAFPILLVPVPPRVREAEPGDHHQGERARGEVHRQPSVHGRQRARARRQDRVQHSGGPAVGLRLRQFAGAAGLGHRDRRPRGVQPASHAPAAVPGTSAAARRGARPRPRGVGEARAGAGGEVEEPEELGSGLAGPAGDRVALGAPGDRSPGDAVERRGGGRRRGGGFRHRLDHDEQHPRRQPRDEHARPPLRRLGLRRRRQVQVQRPRGEVRPRQGRRGRLRVQAQHRRQRLREMSAVPLRSTLGASHRQGCQRMQRLVFFLPESPFIFPLSNPRRVFTFHF